VGSLYALGLSQRFPQSALRAISSPKSRASASPLPNADNQPVSIYGGFDGGQYGGSIFHGLQQNLWVKMGE
jgi:hypothetical protein